MQKLDKILLPALNKKGIGKEALAAQICFYAGECSNGLCKPISYSAGTLKVSVQSSSQASELEIQKEQYLEKINGKIGKKLLKNLRIVNSN